MCRMCEKTTSLNTALLQYCMSLVVMQYQMRTMILVNSMAFWVVTLSSSVTAWHFSGTHHLHLRSQRACKQETCRCRWQIPGFLQTTGHYNPEDHTLHSHCLENIKSNIWYFSSALGWNVPESEADAWVSWTPKYGHICTNKHLDVFKCPHNITDKLVIRCWVRKILFRPWLWQWWPSLKEINKNKTK